MFVSAVHETEALATECYHGGRNEAYTFGPTDFGDGFMTDIDLSGAYSTAMAAIRMPDWDALYHTKDLAEFRKDRLALARVAFKFPDGCLYPCLPVRSDHGLIFPLEGESYCASPEIELAIQMGADVKIRSGVIVPWASDVRPFELFSRKVKQKRDEFGKGHVFERTWKEIGNSLYGKVAQGLRKKRVFDSRTDETKLLPPSKVTQPFIAAYITSIVRATLGELLTQIPNSKVNISATTDGFITNATLSGLDTSGPLCTFFAEQAERLSGKRKILEVKHVAPQVVCMKTRGQLTVGYLSDTLKPIKAKAGVQTPKDDISREDIERAQLENDWLLDLFVARTPETTVSAQQLTSMREMHLHDRDMVMEEREKRVNLEYDWKRELIEPEMVVIGRVIRGESHKHIALRSKPHRTIKDFTEARSRFDEWQKTHTLKTIADWEDWREFERRKALKARGEVTGHGRLVDQCKRQFLKDFANDVCGIKDGTYKELAGWLTEQGYPTTDTDIKNSKRSAVEGDIDWTAAEDRDVRELLAAINGRYDWPKV